MAERWVSVGKKYCDICKCWFADNRASIEFHERGDKHRNALAQKLKDVGRQRELKEHAEINIKGQLAAMQAGAMLQMRKYGEEVTEGPSLPATGIQGSKYFDPRQAGQDVSAMASEMARLADQRKNGKYRLPEAPGGPVPVRINKEALAKAQKHARLEAERKARKKAKLEIEKEKQKAEAEEAAKETAKETKQWVQAETEEGQVYFWHMYTGDTIWEAPAEYFTQIEYEIYLATLEAEREIVHNFDLAESEQREIAEGGVDSQAAAEYEQYYGSNHPESSEYLLEIKKKRDRGAKKPRHRLPKAQPAPQPGTLYAPGAIGFTKQAISGRLNDVEDVNSIPMPLFEPGAEPKMEIPEPEEEPQVQNYAPKEPEPERIVDTNTGFGGWTKVAKKEEPEKFFSPLTARYRELEELEKKEAAEAAANPTIKKEEKEEKVEFTEKVATIKTKGKVEFKKRAPAGGSKNARQRVD